MGFLSIQTVCFELWVDLYRAWTWIYMFSGGFLKGLLVFSAAERITLPLELFFYDNRARLSRLTILVDSWLGRYAR